MAAVEDGIGSETDDRWFRRELFFGVVLISQVAKIAGRKVRGKKIKSFFVDFQNRRLCGQMLQRRKAERRLKLQCSSV